jgi:hypothetical protein
MLLGLLGPYTHTHVTYTQYTHTSLHNAYTNTQDYMHAHNYTHTHTHTHTAWCIPAFLRVTSGPARAEEAEEELEAIAAIYSQELLATERRTTLPRPPGSV